MITRREFNYALSGLCAAPLGVFAQARTDSVNTPSLAIISRTSAAKNNPLEKPLVDTLRKLGWIDGENITIQRYYAENDVPRLPALVGELIKRRPSVIYTTDNDTSRLLVAATQTIPIVLGSSSEILARGWAKSFAQPGGNVTGILNIGPELGPKRLQLLKQALPKAMKIGVLVYSPGAQTLRELNLIEQSSKELRVAIVSASTKIPVDLENAFSTFAKNRVDAVVSTHSVFFQTESAYLVSLSAIHRIPFIAHRSDMAEQGALFSYGSVIEEQFRRAAHLIDKVLRGAKPGDLPVEQPSIFELVINRRTARMLGIGIPDSLLLQATRVIQ